METLKVIHYTKSGERYRFTSLRYALDERKVLWRCFGVQSYSHKAVYHQMKIVSDFWGNTGKNPVFHFMISFEKRTINDPYLALAYAKDIFADLLDDHQGVISVHMEDQITSLYHVHVVISTTNFLTGDLLVDKHESYFVIGQNIANITNNLCLLERPKYKGDPKPFRRVFAPEW